MTSVIFVQELKRLPEATGQKSVRFLAVFINFCNNINGGTYSHWIWTYN